MNAIRIGMQAIAGILMLYIIARSMFFSAGAPLEKDEEGYEEYRKKIDDFSRKNKNCLLMAIALTLIAFAIGRLTS